MTGLRSSFRAARFIVPAAAVVIAAAVAALAVRQARALRREAESAWTERLRGNAAASSAAIEAWLSERRNDARVVAGEVADMVAGVDASSARAAPAGAATGHVASMLSLVREGYRYLGAWALDSSGRLVARAESGGAPAAIERDSALAAARDGRERLIGPYRDADGALRAAVIAPVFLPAPAAGDPRPDIPAGAVILAFDLRRRLLAVAAPSHYGSIVRRELATRTPEGTLVVSVSPPDWRPSVALLPDGAGRPPGRVVAAAALAHDTAGLFTDATGTAMLAATRRIDGLPWAMIHSVALEDALGPVRAETRADALALIALGALGLVGIATASRSVRAVQRRAEAATEAQYRVLAEHVSDVIARQTIDGRLLFVSPACHAVLGYEPSELVGRSCDDVIHPDDLAAVHAAREQALGGSESVSARCRMRRRDGAWLWVETSHRAVRNAAGAAAEMVCVMHDVSARQHAEDELRRQALLFDTISDAVLILEASARIVDWNPAAERIFGYARGEVLGRTPAMLDDPAARPGPGETIGAALAADERWSGEVRFRARDGRSGIADVVVVPMRDANGAVTGWAAVLRDITRRREMEAALSHREALLREAQKLEAIGRLAGGVAHDFNNELTAITSNVAIAMAALPPGHPAGADLVEIRDAATRAASLTRQLLAFGRRQVMQPANVDVNAVIESAERMYRGLLGERITLALRLGNDVGPVRADAGQLREVLLSLMLHARDAMPDGGSLSIGTTRETLRPTAMQTHPGLEPGEYAVIRLHDTGAGMDEETRSRLFEPFFTSKSLGKGGGLGLSASYGIVRQSSGDIEVESAPGRGTTFSVYLPSVSADEPPPSASRQPAPAPARSRATVLLVEDEEAVRTPVRRILAREEITVIEAGTGEDALRASDAHVGPIDLVITDVVMPGMDGPELVGHLRERRPGIKVLFMSGYTEQAVVQHGVLAADAAFVAKPFSIEEFVAKVRELLGRGAPIA